MPQAQHKATSPTRKTLAAMAGDTANFELTAQNEQTKTNFDKLKQHNKVWLQNF